MFLGLYNFAFPDQENCNFGLSIFVLNNFVRFHLINENPRVKQEVSGCGWMGERHRPGLQVDDGVLHRLLVVFPHVLVHVRVVGADVFLRAAVGHRAELEGRVLLLWMLELSGWGGGGVGDRRAVRRGSHRGDLSDLILSTSQTNLHTSNRREVVFTAAK